MDHAEHALIKEAVIHMDSCVYALLRLQDCSEDGEFLAALCGVAHQIEQMQSALEAL